MVNPATPAPAAADRRGRAWTWAIVFIIAGLAFWASSFVEKTVAYSPWFLEQVEGGNIEFISIQGTQVRGRLRSPRVFHDPREGRTVEVRWFVTGLPSAEAVQEVVDALDEQEAAGGEPVQVRWEPPPMSWGAALGLAAFGVLVLFIPGVAAMSYWAGYARGYRRGRSEGPPSDGKAAAVEALPSDGTAAAAPDVPPTP